MTDEPNGPKTVSMWAIYEHPTDHPDAYVMREWLVSESGAMPGNGQVFDTLEAARAAVPAAATRIDWPGEPDPHIVETYM